MLLNQTNLETQLTYLEAEKDTLKKENRDLLKNNRDLETKIAREVSFIILFLNLELFTNGYYLVKAI